MAPVPKTVIVVGGGWAGLSCAVELSRRGFTVTLLESARQLGGRARRVEFDDHAVDNGQHVLIGAYRNTLGLIEFLGLDTTDTLFRQHLHLNLLYSDRRSISLKLPGVLAPLNLLIGLVKARGFSLRDRWHILRLGLKIFTNAIILDSDFSVAELLQREKQTPRAIEALWDPICLASLNTPVQSASARVFVRVLHDTFCRNQTDSDLIIPAVDLGSLIPDPALDYIEQHGGNVHLGKRVNHLLITDDQLQGVVCDKETFTAQHVVLALPPFAIVPLIKDLSALDDITYNLNSFTYNPIVTLYIKYPEGVELDEPIQALLGMTSQWVIDRRLTQRPGLMAVVISGPGEHMQMDNDELIITIQNELADLFPHWPEAEQAMVIREKRATFDCRSGINLLRPTNRTALPGLWLAGDFTNTGYPATLESAIISGQHSAELILQSAQPEEP